MLGSPPRPHRLWPDPPPAHTNGFDRYLYTRLDSELGRGIPRIAHLAQPQTYQPTKVEEQLFASGFTRSVSQVHQVISEETTNNNIRKSEHFPSCKANSGGWSVKALREGGCSRTTPRCVVKSEPGQQQTQQQQLHQQQAKHQQHLLQQKQQVQQQQQQTPCQVQEITTSCKTTGDHHLHHHHHHQHQLQQQGSSPHHHHQHHHPHHHHITTSSTASTTTTNNNTTSTKTTRCTSSSTSSSSYCVLGRGVVTQRNYYSTSSSSSLMEGNKSGRGGNTTGGIPVGIAIARQRVQQQTTPPPLTVVTCQERQTNQGSAWPLAPPHWQIQGNGVDQGLSLQPAHMGLQLGRDPISGQFVLFPSSGIGDNVQRTVVWPGSPNVPPPPLQVMQAPPQPLLLDRLVAVTPGQQHDKRRHDPPPLTGVMVPCDFSKSGGSNTSGSTCLGQATAASQGLALIHNLHPAPAAPHQFSSVLIHQMPFTAAAPQTTQQHNNSLLLSTQLTEQALINQNLNTSVVISNHQLSENTVINPQLLGGMEGLCGLQHMSPSVVISHHHTETNSFVRSDIAPVIPGHVLIKEEVKQEVEEEEEHHPLPLVDQATSPPSISEDTKSEYSEEDIKERVVQDAQNQTETPAVSDEDTNSQTIVPANLQLLPLTTDLEQVKKENVAVEQTAVVATVPDPDPVIPPPPVEENNEVAKSADIVESLHFNEKTIEEKSENEIIQKVVDERAKGIVEPVAAAPSLPIAVQEKIEGEKDVAPTSELKVDQPASSAIYTSERDSPPPKSPQPQPLEECEIETPQTVVSVAEQVEETPDLSGMQLLLNGIDQYETVRGQITGSNPVETIVEEQSSIAAEAVSDDNTIPSSPPSSPPPTEPTTAASTTALHGLGLLCELARQRIEDSEETERDVTSLTTPSPAVNEDSNSIISSTSTNSTSRNSSSNCAEQSRVTSLGQEELKEDEEEEEEEEVIESLLREKRENDIKVELRRNVPEHKKQVHTKKLQHFKRRPGRPKKNSHHRKKDVTSVTIPSLNEPPVLEPWCASPSKSHPLLSPPTLTPNKRKSLDSPTHSSQESDSNGNPPPLSPCSSSKKRKVGRPRKSEEPTNTETIVSQRNKGLVGLLLHNSHDEKEPSPPPIPKVNKIRPKLKAEAKVKSWCDDDELELSPPKPKLEPTFKSTSTWRFPILGKSVPKRPKSKSPEKKRKISPCNISKLSDNSTSSNTPQINSPTLPPSPPPPIQPSASSPKLTRSSSPVIVVRKVLSPVPTSSIKSNCINSPIEQIVSKSGENSHKSPVHRSSQSRHSNNAAKLPKPNSNMPECKLKEEHLSQLPCPIMMAVGGLFYTGQVTQAKAEGIYEVILEKERHRKPHILCSEELINNAILEVRLEGVSLSVGTRLCAYWSQQYNCLYPGVVCSDSSPNDKFVSVEFDDGDNGTINRDDIRLLPHDYPMIEYDPNPLSTLGKKRRHNSTNSADCPNKSGERPQPTPEPPNLDFKMKDNDEDIRVAENNKNNNENVKEGISGVSTIIDSMKEDEEEGSGTEATLPAETIPSIISVLEDFLQSEQERKRLKKKRKKLSHLKNGVKLHRHKHKEGCKTRHKRKHKHHRKHKHKHSLDSVEMRIKESTVSLNDDGNNEKGPLITTIVKPTEPTCAKKKCTEHKVPSVANRSKSKIAAFLPARHEMWDWRGPGVKRGRAAGHRGPRKTFYKAIQRGSDIIKIGDCAVFVSTGRPDRPFIGQVESLWATKKNSMAVKVSWFYHPEETIGAPDNLPFPGALFKSPHTDSNDVQTISHRCDVISLAEFTKKAAEKDFLETVYENHDTYYLAGHYDPHDTKIEFEPGIG